MAETAYTASANALVLYHFYGAGTRAIVLRQKSTKRGDDLVFLFDKP